MPDQIPDFIPQKIESLETPEDNLEALVKTDQALIDTLKNFFKSVPVRRYHNNVPYVEIFNDATSTAEIVYMLETLNVFAFEKDDSVVIDGAADIARLEIFGIIDTSLPEAPPDPAVYLPGGTFLKHKESIPEVFNPDNRLHANNEAGTEPRKRRDTQEDDETKVEDVVLDVLPPDEPRDLNFSEDPENLPEKNFYFGPTSFLGKHSKGYRWDKGHIFKKIDGKEVELDYEKDYMGVLKKAREGDRAAREEFIKMNIGLCYLSAHNFNEKIPMADTNDLLQEAVIALNHAIDGFDLEHGTGSRFSTYAVVTMDWKLFRWFENNARTIRIPTHRHRTMNIIRRFEARIIQDLGSDYEPALGRRVAEKAGIPYEKLLRLRKEVDYTSNTFTSLENELESPEMVDDSKDPLEGLAREELAMEVKEVLENLTNRERHLLMLRFGIPPVGESYPLEQVEYPLGHTEYSDYTLEEIGDMFGLTRERIRQIESKALRKLRHPSRSGALMWHMESRLTEAEEDKARNQKIAEHPARRIANEEMLEKDVSGDE